MADWPLRKGQTGSTKERRNPFFSASFIFFSLKSFIMATGLYKRAEKGSLPPRQGITPCASKQPPLKGRRWWRWVDWIKQSTGRQLVGAALQSFNPDFFSTIFLEWVEEGGVNGLEVLLSNFNGPNETRQMVSRSRQIEFYFLTKLAGLQIFQSLPFGEKSSMFGGSNFCRFFRFKLIRKEG